MLILDGSSDPANKIVCFSAPGAHMSWVAAMVGSLYDRWPLEDMIVWSDGSAHHVKEFLPHYSRHNKPFTLPDYNKHLDDEFGSNGNPTIYHDGFSTAYEARLWPTLLGQIGKRKDTLLIPIMCWSMQESIYALLNVISKQTAESEMKFLEAVTGVVDDGSMPIDDLLVSMSFRFYNNWAIITGLPWAHQTQTKITVSDIHSGNIINIFYNNPQLGQLIKSQKERENYLWVLNRSFNAANQKNWALSLSMINGEHTTFPTNDRWANKDSPIMKVLYHWLARRRFNIDLTADFEFSQWISPHRFHPIVKVNRNDYHFGEPEYQATFE